ncbi:MAG: pyridoxamine 5'-phosphate oxidase family protein [Emcibacter sp.]|nr:pyridoxamine 5'-phosphate oxidase family protein [Emcibacter sp.]
MTDITDDDGITPFHRGELEIQDRLGVRERVHSYAPRFVRNHIPPEHSEFFGQLPQLIVGSVDKEGRPWASMLVGRPGFISSPDPKRMSIEARPLYGDPLADNLKVHSPVGLLGIEFHTRRRNRLNGRIEGVDADGFHITVDQSFGNCPQYIQARGFDLTEAVDSPEEPRPITRDHKIGEIAGEAIARADTFFIASVFSEDDKDRRHGVDVSHRGGKPGFVHIVDEKTLIFPDFTGNFHFHTLGNISLNPKAGLLFPDFETGNIIYITGTAEIIWDGEELNAFVGAERLVRITVEEIIRVEDSLPLRSEFRGYAPDLARTGSWEAVAETIENTHDRDRWRRFTVGRIEQESETISSFYLMPEDGKALAGYEPGKFLPIRLEIPGEKGFFRRTYTVSETPNGDFYRLSIKREDAGLVSRYFHDHITPGSVVEAMAPRGKFTLVPDSIRPVVLLSGGVGITPMIAMLDHLLLVAAKSGQSRPIYFIHGTQNGREHAFGDHVRQLGRQVEDLTIHVAYAEPEEDDLDHDSVGYIDAPLLRSILPLDDYDFYLCGPPPFMTAVYDSLSGLGVPESRVHYESFGPAMVLKSEEQTKNSESIPQVAAGPVAVCFSKSGIEAEWRPEKGTLLELAEAEGLTPDFSCRNGSCGSCAIKVKCGGVTYLDDPMASHEDDEVLICCSTPKSIQGKETCGKEYGLTLDL